MRIPIRGPSIPLTRPRTRRKHGHYTIRQRRTPGRERGIDLFKSHARYTCMHLFMEKAVCNEAVCVVGSGFELFKSFGLRI